MGADIMYELTQVEHKARKHLLDGNDPESWRSKQRWEWKEYLNRKAVGGNSGAKSIYIAFLGRWKLYLVLELTQAVFSGSDVGRQRIREWQQRVFGRSMDSKLLKAYGKFYRMGGGRVKWKEPSKKIEDLAKTIFETYKELLGVEISVLPVLVINSKEALAMEAVFQTKLSIPDIPESPVREVRCI